MSMPKNLSLSFRLLRKLRLIHSKEKYGNKSFPVIAWLMFKTAISLFKRTLKRLAYGYCYFGLLFNEANKTWLRAWLWRKMGAHVGGGCQIHHRVDLDYWNADKIFVEDEVSISNGVTLLCHQRNLELYSVGDLINSTSFKYGEIHLKKGCFIGINSTIMPGVTVGEGAIVGACSVVTKDVPPWTVAVGSPAKVVREIAQRDQPE